MPRIDVESLSFEYSSEKKTLTDINLHLDGKGLYCIVGPNGVGKSTLVKCIDGLLKPSQGDVLINGMNIRDMGLKQIAEKIAYVPVASDDLFALPVIESIILGIDNRHTDHNENLEKAQRILELLNMQSFTMRSTNELSAGQKQKVAIARGLIREPDILILDEPTANLDLMHQIYITELLKVISERMDILVLMISHDLNIASRYADQMIIMVPPGKIGQIGKPNDVVTEDMISNVYNVECNIVDNDGRPFVMPKTITSLPNSDD